MEENPISDPFWYDDFNILFKQDNLTKFFPDYKMTLIEKLNAIVRLSIYLGLILYAVTKTYQYLYIPIITLAITYLIFFNYRDKVELFLNSYDSTLNKINQQILETPPSVKPTVNNPFITDPKNQPPAEKSWDIDIVKEDIENNFDHNLYKDVSDLFGKSNSQRQYYTMPSTTLPNNQTEFAKWCYNTGPTCKESSIDCASPYTPIQSTTDVYKNIPKTY